MCIWVPLLEFLKYFRKVEVFHVDICILKVLIEGANAVEEGDVMKGKFE